MQILQFLEAKKEFLSDTTRRSYQNSLDLLHRFIKGLEPTKEEVIAWLKTMQSPATLQVRKSAVLRYWGWRFPGDSLVFPRDTFTPSKQEVLKVTTVPIIRSLIAAADNPDDKFFMECLFTLGCRIRELLAVKYSDIIDTGIVMWVKGRKQRVVPAPAAFLVTLKTYGFNKGVEIAFRRGKEGIIFQKSYNHYYNLIKRLGEQIGHPELSPHYFRHAYTIDLLNRGLSDTDVAHARGDKNLNMIFRYSGLTEKGLQDKLEGNR
jgi:integrase